ncbi:tyrosine-type recombinase/integrase [Heliorestis acidaminivorans]|uniref:Tyrosine-type recombinase/integrase n=1 Tax=Heliorestis acidaminivorans TaxID=553427 RepID=A0A6I0ERX5_9FIRM|nr:site-specific integrase [Heliorestis acidaminivorans]KAB2951505.1 tyrosine-type recombinase/integrase [Heliorestis acidaminivorans]
METRKPIEALSAEVIKELERLNYAYNTVCGLRASFKRICAFAQDRNELYFSENLGKEYLKEKYSCTTDYYLESFPPKAKQAIRSVRLLGDYQLHGVVIRRIKKRKGYVKPPQFEAVLTAYEKECKSNEYSLRGMRTRLQRLFFFVDYLSLRRVADVSAITPEIISDYVISIYPNHEKSIGSILTTLRVFLRFLYLNEYIKQDLSLTVPKQNKYYYPPVPSTWEPDEVRRMLDAIDRGSPLGKRDYAILLLVAKLGIRAGDIKALKLSDLNWTSKTITITQQKTKVEVAYPILHDVGWALIDYLQHARPLCDTPYLFVRLNAPFEAFGENANLHNIITKYTRLAGIAIPRGKRHGLHSLRHSLASTLLEQGASLAVISEILGHVDSKSTSVYLHADMKGLRACALDPEEVLLDD